MSFICFDSFLHGFHGCFWGGLSFVIRAVFPPISAWNDLRASRQGVHHVNQCRGLDAPVLKRDLDCLLAVEAGVALKHVHPRQGGLRDRQ